MGEPARKCIPLINPTPRLGLWTSPMRVSYILTSTRMPGDKGSLSLPGNPRPFPTNLGSQLFYDFLLFRQIAQWAGGISCD